MLTKKWDRIEFEMKKGEVLGTPPPEKNPVRVCGLAGPGPMEKQ